MDEENLGKVWIITRDEPDSGQWGGINVSREGLIVTSAEFVEENVKLKGRPHDGKWRSLKVRCLEKCFGLAVLEVGALTDMSLSGAKSIPYFNLGEIGGDGLKRGDEVIGVFHDDMMAFTPKFAQCSYPFPKDVQLPAFSFADRVTLGDLRKSEEECNEDEEESLDEKIEADPRYDMHRKFVPYFQVAQAAHSSDCSSLMQLNPYLPLIQVHGFRSDNEVLKDICVGCPVFHVNKNRLLGLFMFNEHIYQYIIPLAFISSFLGHFCGGGRGGIGAGDASGRETGQPSSGSSGGSTGRSRQGVSVRRSQRGL